MTKMGEVTSITPRIVNPAISPMLTVVFCISFTGGTPMTDSENEGGQKSDETSQLLKRVLTAVPDCSIPINNATEKQHP